MDLVKPPIFRFAPSPNGYLHLGHAYSALKSQDLCQKLGGKMLLRIEDIDTQRCHAKFEQAIFEDLAWLGFTWSGPVIRQSEHMAYYHDVLTKLDHHEYTFNSFLSRREHQAIVEELELGAKEPWPRDPDGSPRYVGVQQESRFHEGGNRKIGKPIARLNVSRAIQQFEYLQSWQEFSLLNGKTSLYPHKFDIRNWGEVILLRRDISTSYHIASVVDDHLQGVTHIVRGKDLYAATAIHRMLQRMLGYEQPLYHHHRLITDEAGEKLAKSKKSTAIRTLRMQGIDSRELRSQLLGMD